MPLNKLTSLQLQRMYKTLLTKGRIDRIESRNQPKGLSAKTVRNINQIISSAMDVAIEQKIISENPTNGCALPKIERKKMHTIPAEQLGLKWSDMDFAHGIIHIRRQISRIDGVIREMPLKTKTATATVQSPTMP